MTTAIPATIALSGPTASGKSDLALRLALAYDAEIISADSVQVYRGLDIGSAKASPDERAEVTHHCLDLLDPTEQSDAVRWATHAKEALEDIRSRGKRAIIVGGTGLYFRTLFEGFADIPDVPDAMKTLVADRLQAEGCEALHRELAAHDPVSAARIAPLDTQRVTRALAVALGTEKTLTEWHRSGGSTGAVGPEILAATAFVTLTPERALHRSRIEARARAMLRDGLIDEVRGLLASGTPEDAPGLRTLGYRAVVAALTVGRPGPLDPDALAPKIATGHAQYAKRQVTWFRGSAGQNLGWRAFDPAELVPLDAPAVARRLWPSAS